MRKNGPAYWYCPFFLVLILRRYSSGLGIVCNKGLVGRVFFNKSDPMAANDRLAWVTEYIYL